MNYIFIAFEELEEGLGTGHITRVKRIIKVKINFILFIYFLRLGDFVSPNGIIVKFR